MNKEEITKFLDSYNGRKERTIVIIDYSNVEKWKANLGWRVGISELSRFVRYFSVGSKFLRRFYYGSDYGPHERALTLTIWSNKIQELARMYRLDVVTKRVKYIHRQSGLDGYEKKCDLDVEMAIDLVREKDNYDTAVVFSGDGDLVYAMRYLHEIFDKKFIVFGARGHTGKEVQDGLKEGVIERIFYADDFEHRLNMDR